MSDTVRLYRLMSRRYKVLFICAVSGMVVSAVAIPIVGASVTLVSIVVWIGFAVRDALQLPRGQRRRRFGDIVLALGIGLIGAGAIQLGDPTQSIGIVCAAIGVALSTAGFWLRLRA